MAAGGWVVVGVGGLVALAVGGGSGDGSGVTVNDLVGSGSLKAAITPPGVDRPGVAGATAGIVPVDWPAAATVGVDDSGDDGGVRRRSIVASTGALSTGRSRAAAAQTATDGSSWPRC